MAKKPPPAPSRNKQRKTTYAAQATTHRTKSEKRAAAKRRRTTRVVGARTHQHPCGNPACARCYVGGTLRPFVHDGARYVYAADLARAARVSWTAIHKALRDERLSGAVALDRILVTEASAQAYIATRRARRLPRPT